MSSRGIKAARASIRARDLPHHAENCGNIRQRRILGAINTAMIESDRADTQPDRPTITALEKATCSPATLDVQASLPCRDTRGIKPEWNGTDTQPAPV
jgi:hypothetical protein